MDQSKGPLPLIAILDGEIAWDVEGGHFDPAITTCLPPCLFKAFADMPHFVDLRPEAVGDDHRLRNPAYLNALATLAAPLYDLSKRAILGEDMRERRVRMGGTIAAFLAVLWLGIYALGQAAMARTSKEVAEENERRALISERTALRNYADAKEARAESQMQRFAAVVEKAKAEKQSQAARKSSLEAKIQAANARRESMEADRQARLASINANNERTARKDADARRIEATEANARTVFELASKNLQEDPTMAASLLTTMPPDSDLWPAARTVLAAAKARGIARHVFREGKMAIFGCAFSEDGSRVAYCGMGGLRVRNLADGKVTVYGKPDVFQVAIFISGNKPHTISLQGEVLRWDSPTSWKRLLLIPERELTSLPVVHHDGKAVVWEQDNDVIGVWTRQSGARAYNVDGADVDRLDISHDGRWALATSSRLMVIDLLKPKEGPIKIPHPSGEECGQEAWFDGTNRRIFVRMDGYEPGRTNPAAQEAIPTPARETPKGFATFRSYDLRLKKWAEESIQIPFPDDESCLVAPTPGAAGFMVASNNSSKLWVWNRLREDENPAVLELGEKGTEGPSDPGGDEIIAHLVQSRGGWVGVPSLDLDGTIRVWNPKKGISLALGGFSGYAICTAFSRDGSSVMAGSIDGEVRIWKLAAPRPRQSVLPHRGIAASGPLVLSELAAVSPRGRLMAFRRGELEGEREKEELAFEERSLYILDRNTKRVAEFTGPFPYLGYPIVSFSQDESRAAIMLEETLGASVYLWSQTQGFKRLYRHTRERTGERGEYHVALSSDGKTVVSSGPDGLRAWGRQYRRGAHDRLRRQFSDAVTISKLEFAASGSSLLVAEGDKHFDGGRRSIKVYDMVKESLWELPYAGTCAISGNGLRVAVAGSSGYVSIIERGGVSRSWRVGRTAINSMLFSPDSRRVVSTSEEGELRLWDSSFGAGWLLDRRRSYSGWGPLAFSPDGRSVLEYDSNNKVNEWHDNLPTSGAELLKLLKRTTNLKPPVSR